MEYTIVKIYQLVNMIALQVLIYTVWKRIYFVRQHLAQHDHLHSVGKLRPTSRKLGATKRARVLLSKRCLARQSKDYSSRCVSIGNMNHNINNKKLFNFKYWSIHYTELYEKGVTYPFTVSTIVSRNIAFKM